MKKIYLAMGCIAALSLHSCDFLDREPMDAVSKDQFFETANATSLEQYCNDFYPKLIKGHGDPNAYGFGILGNDFNSDDILPWDRNTTSFGLHTAPTEKKDTEWQWENIRACNDFLDNYMKSPESDVVKQRYAGIILFFKTYDYFNKVKAYGDVPWFEHVMNPGDEEMYKGRDSRTVVMANMLRDINQAIAWLPKKTDVTLVSRDAALALKARMCLFEGTWRRYHKIEGDTELLQAALDAATELMKPEYGYSLFKGSTPGHVYYELFIQADYTGNPEIIFSKAYDPALGKGNNLTRQIFVGEDPMGMSKNCADNYLCATTGKPISMCNCPGHTQHTTLIAELQNRDPRLLQTIPTPEPGEYTYYLNGKVPNIAKLTETGAQSCTSTGYPVIKYYDPLQYTAAHHQGTEDAPIFRLGEIMLIRAEASAELGKITQEELDATVNALRQRVGFTHKLMLTPAYNDPKLAEQFPNITSGNVNLIREIRRERRVEMFGEGFRYDDIRRWACGKLLEAPRLGIIIEGAGFDAATIKILKETVGVNAEGALTVYDKRYAGKNPKPIFEDPKHYLISIPLNEIAKAPNLAPNNPGW